MLIFKGHS